MSYRKELEELIVELRNKSNQFWRRQEARDKAHRQSEIIDFLITHPEEAIKNLDS